MLANEEGPAHRRLAPTLRISFELDAVFRTSDLEVHAAHAAHAAAGHPRIAGLSSGISLTAASVVISRPATEAASCSAVRTTLVGSITPAATRFS